MRLKEHSSHGNCSTFTIKTLVYCFVFIGKKIKLTCHGQIKTIYTCGSGWPLEWAKHLWGTYLPSHVMRSSGQTSVSNKNLPRSSYHSKHLDHLQHHHHHHHRLFLKIVLYKALSFFDIQYRLSQVSINAAWIWLERVINGIHAEALALCRITLLSCLAGSLFYWESSVWRKKMQWEREDRHGGKVAPLWNTWGEVHWDQGWCGSSISALGTYCLENKMVSKVYPQNV